MRFVKQDEVINDNKKSIGFTFGISAELKERSRIRVTLTFDDNSWVTFNIDKDTEKIPVKESYEGPGGIETRAIFSTDKGIKK
ncbi:MAG: hypothetical protein PHI59_10025 [Candidatus Omnitrophica bacterium]|nr:hypothetical protein [Candidatus Omnitrophota bacterium]